MKFGYACTFDVWSNVTTLISQYFCQESSPFLGIGKHNILYGGLTDEM